MKYVLQINVDNAAFDSPNCGLEIARILRRVASEVEDIASAVVMRRHGLRDANGNRVGEHSISLGHVDII